MTSPSPATRLPTKGSTVTGPSEKATLRMGPCGSGLLSTVTFSLEFALSMQLLEFLTPRFLERMVAFPEYFRCVIHRFRQCGVGINALLENSSQISDSYGEANERPRHLYFTVFLLGLRWASLVKLRMNWAHGSQDGFCLCRGKSDPVSWAESGEPESSFPPLTQHAFPCPGV